MSRGHQRDIHSNNTSGFAGVHLNPKSGHAQAWIAFNGRRYYLGQFATAEEASRHYRHAEQLLKEGYTL